jgi:hypothetical protein
MGPPDEDKRQPSCDESREKLRDAGQYGDFSQCGRAKWNALHDEVDSVME